MPYGLLPHPGWPVKLKVMAFVANSSAFKLAGHPHVIIQSSASRKWHVGPCGIAVPKDFSGKTT